MSDDKIIGMIPAIGAIVTTEFKRPASPVENNFNSAGGNMAYWGENNRFPQDIIKDVRKDPEIGTMLDKQARLLYSSGLIFGTLDYLDNGEEIIKPADATVRKEINEWLQRSNINRYLYEGARDLYFFYNCFVEVIRSVDKTKVVQLCVQAAENCRLQKQNSKSGIIENCYINSNFPNEDENSERTIKRPLIDPYYDAAESLRKDKTSTNHIYHISIPTAGCTYYQRPDWNSVRESGWLELSQIIPKIKKSFIENSLVIKYHIEVSDLFWSKKYPGFDSKTNEEKAKIKDTEFTTFSNIMSGVEKSGNSIFTPIITDPILAKEYSLWKITPIDDKIKDGKFLEEAKDASIYKATAVGLHPALIGSVPNTGLGGAGSNIREAYNLHMLSVKAHQDILLEPLDLVKRYNGWPDDIVFRFRSSYMNTLDKGKETTQIKA